ncbi:hypothetical protein GCM10017688_09570 [Streptomyces ramulosus]
MPESAVLVGVPEVPAHGGVLVERSVVRHGLCDACLVSHGCIVSAGEVGECVPQEFPDRSPPRRGLRPSDGWPFAYGVVAYVVVAYAAWGPRSGPCGISAG